MNALYQLQEDVVAYALGNPATAVIPINWFRKQVTESLAQEALAAWDVREAGKIGLTSLVLMPALRSKFTNVGNQYSLELIIRTFEDGRVNTTGQTAEAVGKAHLDWLDGLLIEDLTQLYPSTDKLALQPNYDFPGFFVYDSTLRGELPAAPLQRTANVEFAEVGAAVHITCSDPDALVYATADGTAPQPGLAAHLYAGPLTVAVGAIVRAVAWNPARLPSHIAKATKTP